LYLDAFGIKRKIQTCIMVGVEDVNAKRWDCRNMPDPMSGRAPIPSRRTCTIGQVHFIEISYPSWCHGALDAVRDTGSYHSQGKLPGFKTHPEVLLTDTVGFIKKLPTQLVAAFRATLEEVREANVLIHVIDVSNPMWQKQE